MKILLIRNNTLSDTCETNITGIYPPLGLAYIGSVLKNAGYAVSLLDNQALGFRPNRLKQEIKKSGAELFLLSSMTPSWQQNIALSRLIKQVLPQAIIGIGGPHLSAYPEESLAAESLDFAIYGEGELTILEVLQAIREKTDFSTIPGLIFRKNNKVLINRPRGEIADLDTIPFPAIELLPYKRYFALSAQRPIFTMVTSRGCPYACNFCFQGYLGSYRSRSPENVVGEIELLVKKYGIREIIFFDETFAVEEKRALEICALINKKGLKFSWDIRTRAQLLTKQLLGELKSAGCSRINIGIESGDQATLDKMNKKTDIAMIREKVRLIKQYGLETRAYFMLAYPGETKASIARTIEFAKSLPLDWASFTLTIGLPKTEIYQQALNTGLFPNDYWRDYTLGNTRNKEPYFTPEGMSEPDLFGYKRKAYREFYLRPIMLWKIITKKQRLAGLAKDFSQFFRLAPSIFRSICNR